MIRHQPVLAPEIYEIMPKDTKVYLDGTLGHGGHVEYILSRLDDRPIKVIGIDRDNIIISKTQTILDKYKNKIFFLNQSYAKLDNMPLENGEKIDFFLLDLGVNLEHFKDGSRGFSIQSNAPLDMRFDTTQGNDAETFVNKSSAETLSQTFNQYGDFGKGFADKMAEEIIKVRKQKQIKTTFDLIDILRKIGLGQQKIAVIFQCIRIAVNDELGELKRFLEEFPKFISKGGICAIITYHSIEDRIVKYAFKDLVDTKKFELINKHVIKPSYKETVENKASRSAKLRVIKAL